MVGPVSRRNLAYATVFGLITTFLVYLYLTRSSQPVEREPAQVTVVAAARRLDASTVITQDMLTTAFVSAAEKPALFGPEERPQLIDKVVVKPLEPGRPIRRDDVISRTAEFIGLSFSVPKGMRAVTIPTDAVSGVAGFLKPGNRVDVLATFSANSGTLTKTVLQNVRLLAVGRRATPPTPQEGSKAVTPQESSTATLAVTPAQAERLILAADRGRIRLALRSADDAAPVQTAGVSSREVIGKVLPDITTASVQAPPRTQREEPIYAERSIWDRPLGPFAPTPDRTMIPPAEPVAKKTVELIKGTSRENVPVYQ